MSNTAIIAVIDDDESVRLATKNLLRSLGYLVETFSCAEDYLNGAGKRGVSCLISDVQMPRMTGLELQDKLLERGDHTPMILVTAFPNEKGRAKALAAGAAGYLVKPFDGQALIDCVEAAIGKLT